MQGIAEREGLIKTLLDYHSLERELILGAAPLLLGLALGVKVVVRWMISGFGALSELGSAVVAMVPSGDREAEEIT